jgi:hypothetical protein
VTGCQGSPPPTQWPTWSSELGREGLHWGLAVFQVGLGLQAEPATQMWMEGREGLEEVGGYWDKNIWS